MCLQVEWGEKPRESVTVMSVSQDKSGLPRAALRPATTGTEMLRSFPDPGQGFVSVRSCWLRGFLFLHAYSLYPAHTDGAAGRQPDAGDRQSSQGRKCS